MGIHCEVGHHLAGRTGTVSPVVTMIGGYVQAAVAPLTRPGL